MKIKSYYAATVEAAIAQARRELGDDAMILQSRKAPPEAQHLGECEVVFGTIEKAAPAEAPAPAEDGGRLSRELAELRQEIDAMRRTISRTGAAAPRWLEPGSELVEIYNALAGSELSPELAEEVIHAVWSAAPGDGPRTAQAAAAELMRRITVDASLGAPQSAPAIAALVGPPGAGKTASLVKLAVRYGVAARRPVRILAADTFRVAASEQLRTYASIIGAAFQVVETPRALAQALEDVRNRELVLIDTPGWGPADLEDASELARFLSSRGDIDVHLTLSASMKPADLTRVVDAYQIFRPSKLLFTRLDETGSFGQIVSQAARTGIPVSFFAWGQRVPEDLEPATRERVVDLVMSGQPRRERKAA